MLSTNSSKLWGFVLLFCCSLALVCDAQESTSNKPCPPNETYTPCGSPCQTECSTLNEPCRIQNIRCPDGCYCNEGYARDSNGVCIPKKDCP
ncbi:chymotrypsin-elastase inhibitor ixodidin [Anastrepha obliqua]|uniref:chymotrypsin-elastase inhibitor ixodidin n=1 Tax=Anastrepha obliqua TaxID=95512 RepID=UPI0024093B0E|nr:chymotrypsin-elastase inhibitor ixodidin [Anastrepha obliqua]